jgi:hypothetical protein
MMDYHLLFGSLALLAIVLLIFWAANRGADRDGSGDFDGFE